MKKVLLLLGLLIFSSLALAVDTSVHSNNQVSATIDGKTVLSPLRPNLNMNYGTDGTGNLGLILQGLTTAPNTYSTLRLSGKETSITSTGTGYIINFKANYATVVEGRNWRILYNPTVTVNHNKVTNTVSLTVNHPSLATTNAVFSV